MAILIALLIGGIIGGAMGWFLLESPDTVLFNILMGIVGSLLGLGVYYFLLTDGEAITEGLFSLRASICSIIGTLLFVLGFNGLHKVVSKGTAELRGDDDKPLRDD